MREIEFRGMSGEGIWYYGKLIISVFKGGWVYAIQHGTDIEDDITLYEKIVDSKTIGQFTGLRDNNGKKIYEGDIVEKEDERFIINYKEEYARFCPTRNNGNWIASWNSAWAEKCEVIGNIRENSQLLEVGA